MGATGMLQATNSPVLDLLAGLFHASNHANDANH